jgi:fluoride exporter
MSELQKSAGQSGYAASNDWTNLDEVASTRPVDDVEERAAGHQTLEDVRAQEQQASGDLVSEQPRTHGPHGILGGDSEPLASTRGQVSRAMSQVYVLSNLIFFSILGTLARLGITAINTYPGAPVMFGTLWANFAGCLVMGFLLEDRMLFQHDLGVQRTCANSANGDNEGSGTEMAAKASAKKAHGAIKKTIPLYVGLATGFCGSLTTFSSFIKDSFLAMSNDMVTPGAPGPLKPRNGGYSFEALLAVVFVTASLSLSGIFVGAHIAIAGEHITPSVSGPRTRRVLDILVVVLGWGSWIGAVILAIVPPHDFWRGRAIFSLVFAPLGCLLRFYLSLWLNGKVASFPVGTFVANMIGTAVLGMAWDIAHAQIGGLVGCQVLQGVEDGFCGCLTTISTWAAELSSLKRRHAYAYGVASVVTALVLMIAIMGGKRWSEGFDALLCTT